MTVFKSAVLSSICAAMLVSTAFAENGANNGVKLGFGFDRDFGLVAAFGDINAFVGNKGASVDFIFSKNTLKMDAPAKWYVAAGGYGDWDGDIGVRLPIGVQVNFAQNMDAFAQVMPRFRINHNSDFGLDFAIGARYQF